MCLTVCAAQTRRRDVRVDLRRAQAGVAEQLLDDAQVGAALEQMAGERVSQRVWRRSGRQACGAHQPIEPVADAAHAERRAARVEEERRRRPLRPSPRLSTQRRPTLAPGSARAPRAPGRPAA